MLIGDGSETQSVQTVESTHAIPTFALQEIKLGRLIGRGGFSTVSEVKQINLDDIYDVSEEMTNSRMEFASIAKQRSEESGLSNYVLKTLRHDLPEDEHIKGIVDLAIEAEFLLVLSHPNIIAMRGMANSDPHESRFFVVLDRLVQTLDNKFNYWRKVVGQNSGVWMGPFGYCCAKSHHLFEVWLERIRYARDVANAIAYLHRKKIIYRDLKPDNIGFDEGQQLKIFDFGLAKRLDDTNVVQTESGLYLLTGNTGSLRYMAPEVALGLPYNQAADSFSFGILFWQICALITPFSGFTTKMHAEKVVRDNHRPKPDLTWPDTWSTLMERCWSSDSFARPDFHTIKQVLEEQVDDLLDDEGIVPTRATEIRAKKRRQQVKAGKQENEQNDKRLSTDTRISTSADGPNIKRYDKDVV